MAGSLIRLSDNQFPIAGSAIDKTSSSYILLALSNVSGIAVNTWDLALTLTLSERNALLKRPVNYNLASTPY